MEREVKTTHIHHTLSLLPKTNKQNPRAKQPSMECHQRNVKKKVKLKCNVSNEEPQNTSHKTTRW